MKLRFLLVLIFSLTQFNSWAAGLNIGLSAGGTYTLIRPENVAPVEYSSSLSFPYFGIFLNTRAKDTFLRSYLEYFQFSYNIVFSGVSNQSTFKSFNWVTYVGQHFGNFQIGIGAGAGFFKDELARYSYPWASAIVAYSLTNNFAFDLRPILSLNNSKFFKPTYLMMGISFKLGND